MDKKEILSYVRKCDRELIDVFAQYYESRSTFEQESLSNKRKYLANVIVEEDDSEIVEELKNYCEELAELNDDLKALRKEVATLKETCKSKEEEVKEFKETIKVTKIKKLQTLQKELLNEKQVKEIKSKYDELEEIKQIEKAKKFRKSERRKALLAYSRGVLSALIDGVEREFSEKTNEIIKTTGKYYEHVKNEGKVDLFTIETYSVMCQGLGEKLEIVEEKTPYNPVAMTPTRKLERKLQRQKVSV